MIKDNVHTTYYMKGDDLMIKNKEINTLEDVIKPVANILSFYSSRYDNIQKLYTSYMDGEISFECFRTVLQIEESFIKALIEGSGYNPYQE